jgi:hypothetical protein
MPLCIPNYQKVENVHMNRIQVGISGRACDIKNVLYFLCLKLTGNANNAQTVLADLLGTFPNMPLCTPNYQKVENVHMNRIQVGISGRDCDVKNVLFFCD